MPSFRFLNLALEDSRLTHGTGDTADGPAKGVEIVPGPFAAIDLLGELCGHDVLGVDDVEMGQKDKDLFHSLVKDDRVGLLHELPDDLTLVILDNEDLFRLDHLLDHDETEVGQDIDVELAPTASFIHAHARTGGAEEQAVQVVCVGERGVLHLRVKVRDETGPVLETDLEDVAVVDLGDLDEVEMGVEEDVVMLGHLDEGQVMGKEVGEEEREIHDQLLVCVTGCGVDRCKV